RDTNRKDNEKLVSQYLAPIQMRLEANEAIKKRIYEQFREDKWGILESYVIKVKRKTKSGGVPLMRQDITTIALNNQKIIDHLMEYSGQIRSDNFKNESKTFIRHAQTWINRWSAVAEVINNDDQLPYAEPFPENFPVALKQEIDL